MDSVNVTEGIGMTGTSTIAQFGMSPTQLARHLRLLAKDIETGTPPPGQRVVEIDQWTLVLIATEN